MDGWMDVPMHIRAFPHTVALAVRPRCESASTPSTRSSSSEARLKPCSNGRDAQRKGSRDRSIGHHTEGWSRDPISIVIFKRPFSSEASRYSTGRRHDGR